MKKVFEEVGKGIINFGNIVSALIFLKEFFNQSNGVFLIYGVIFWISMYVLGSVFIKKSEEIKNE